MAQLRRYLVRARDAGIDHTVVFASLGDDYRRANRDIAQLCRRRPHRLTGFAFFHADRDRHRLAPMASEAFDRLALCGMKVHRRDAPLNAELCRLARRFRVPVLYDPEGEVDHLLGFVRRFPDVTFIAPHLGSFADVAPAQLRVIDALRRHPNLYADTSGVRHFDMLRRAAFEAGPHKLLFGSDGPWLHPALELAKIEALGLPARDTARILAGNLLRIMPIRLRRVRARPSVAAGSRVR
jgi:predicted TIM-barrel fold metal-dependent hydrolase